MAKRLKRQNFDIETIPDWTNLSHDEVFSCEVAIVLMCIVSLSKKMSKNLLNAFKMIQYSRWCDKGERCGEGGVVRER